VSGRFVRGFVSRAASRRPAYYRDGMRRTILIAVTPCLLLAACGAAHTAAPGAAPSAASSATSSAAPTGGLGSSVTPRAGGPERAAVARARKAHDYDGDGYGDLVIGATGRVQVVHGSARGLEARPRQAVAGGRKGELFGSSVASADFDRDGHADLAIGAPAAGKGAGAVTIVHGSARGLSDRREEPAGPPSARGFGSALAAADFDGDGRADLAVTGEDAVWVTYRITGREGGRVAWKRLTAPDPDLSLIAAGDVTGDGIDDLAVANVRSEQDGRSGTIYAGSPAGLAGTLAWTFDAWGVGALAIGDLDGDGRGELVAGNGYADAEDPGGQLYVHSGRDGSRTVWTRSSPGMPRGAESATGLGGSVAIGDLDGDGYADVATGATGWSGSVFVLYGGRAGLSGRGAQVFDARSTGVAAPQDVQGFGTAVALGDFDGRDRRELAISVRAEPSVVVVSAGRGPVHLLPDQGETGFGRPLH